MFKMRCGKSKATRRFSTGTRLVQGYFEQSCFALGMGVGSLPRLITVSLSSLGP